MTKHVVSVAVLSLALLASGIARAADAPFDSTAALQKAHALTSNISRAESGPLWTAFDDKMRAAMGDSIRFDAMLIGIHAELGTIEKVIDQQLETERNMRVYRARCKFAKSDAYMQLLIAFAPDGRVAGLQVKPDMTEPYPSTKLDYQTKTELDLPFRGYWYVVWGGRFIEDNYHAVSKSQRFAHDILILKDNESHSGDGKQLTDYYCYGQEILAPGKGTIIAECDSLPDQKPGEMDPTHPLGNFVIIDHGNGEFSVLAHMQPGSLRVKAGDVVDSSTVLGLVGNSGNTTEPHIHYHLMDGPDMTTAEGLPARFREIIVDGKKVPWAELVRGETVSRVQ